jgi:uncharacterized membrane protein YfhO
MKRYEELIENQFSPQLNPDVLNMLNAKYVISQDSTGKQSVSANPYALGHAWFVKQVKYVANSDEEMKALHGFNPKNEAIVDQQYKSLIEGKQIGGDTTAIITLTKYTPDHLTYQTNSTSGQFAVFSEIFYDKGWKMQVDGTEQPYFRANYLLRAAIIPAGKHMIEFIFHPASYYTGEKLSMAGSALLLLALGGAAYLEWKKKRVVKKT